jgi:hypothetical protein
MQDRDINICIYEYNTNVNVGVLGRGASVRGEKERRGFRGVNMVKVYYYLCMKIALMKCIKYVK